jgi:hypothetical protein
VVERSPPGRGSAATASFVKLVNLRPRKTTVAAIDARPMPHPAPATRSNAYERQVWRLKAQVVEFKLEADDDMHLVLFEQGHYMIAEMPLANCLPTTTRDRRAIVAARSRLSRRADRPHRSGSHWEPLPTSAASASGTSHMANTHRVRKLVRGSSERRAR